MHRRVRALSPGYAGGRRRAGDEFVWDGPIGSWMELIEPEPPAVEPEPPKAKRGRKAVEQVDDQGGGEPQEVPEGDA